MSQALRDDGPTPTATLHHGYVDAISEDKKTLVGWIGVSDYSCVDEVNPDYVICQNVERFISRVPGK